MKLTTYREDHSLDVPHAVAVESYVLRERRPYTQGGKPPQAQTTCLKLLCQIYKNGRRVLRRVLIGLTIEGTLEFETLDTCLHLMGVVIMLPRMKVKFQRPRGKNAGWNSTASTTSLGETGWSKPTQTVAWRLTFLN